MTLLTGCSGSKNGTQEPNGTGKGDQKVEVVLWHMESPPHRVQRFQEIIDEFNKQSTTAVVRQEVQDWNQIYQKIVGAVQSNTYPDILFTIPDFTTTVKAMGVVQPVDDLVNELDNKHKYLKAAKDPYFYDGHYWAVPLWGMTQILWYRKDLFRAAGIEKAPETWEELLEYAKLLTKDGQYGIALPAGKNLATDQVVYSLMITAGAADLFDSDGNVIFDNPNTVRAFEFYNELLKYSPPDSANYSWGEPQAAFNNGTAAMAIEKGQYIAPFEKESGRPADDLGFALIPQPSENGQPGSIYYSSGAMILTQDPKKRKAAEEFLRYLLEPEVYGRLLTAEPGLFLPLTEDGMKADSFWSDPVVSKYKDAVQTMLKQSEYGALFGFTSGRINTNIGKISGQNLIAQAVQQMYVQGMSPQEAVKWAQERMEEALGQ